MCNTKSEGKKLNPDSVAARRKRKAMEKANQITEHQNKLSSKSYDDSLFNAFDSNGYEQSFLNYNDQSGISQCSTFSKSMIHTMFHDTSLSFIGNDYSLLDNSFFPKQNDTNYKYPKHHHQYTSKIYFFLNN